MGRMQIRSKKSPPQIVQYRQTLNPNTFRRFFAYTGDESHV